MKLRTDGLVLLTATPLQVHASELWDLLELLGLPEAWTPDAFVRFFPEVAKAAITNESLDWLSILFRANEAMYGGMTPKMPNAVDKLERIENAQEFLRRLEIEPLSLGDSFRPKSVGPPSSSCVEQHPSARSSRAIHANCCGRYFKAGKLSTPVATRRVDDRFIALSMEESELYREVEAYISDTYNYAAAGGAQCRGLRDDDLSPSLGLQLLRPSQTMEKRRAAMGGSSPPQTKLRIDEDVADLVEAGEEIDVETVSTTNDARWR